MRRSTTLAFLFFAACSGAPGSQHGALSAGPAARSYGVDHYAVNGDRVSLYDLTGVELGSVALSAPSAESRLAYFAMLDGSSNDVEITRPVAARFSLALQPSDVYYATLVDPALAPFLARFQIDVKAQAPAPADALAPSDVATCLAANTGAGCYNSGSHPCTTDWDYFQQTDTSALDYPYFAPDISTARSMCADGCYNEWGMTLGRIEDHGGGAYVCYCGYRSSHTTYPASCPRVSCGTVGQRDQVNRQRDCADPGSCANSSPYVGCANW